ncbi:MAG: YqgE/AlgH family protein [Alphaproteobacteria bacterium]|nr:YqgE/AlgH family protein [Alphaproteobacteria bacterium]
MRPSLLIASPQMRDPFFEKTVVLVWQHDEDGAIGVVVNRPLRDVMERGIMPRSASSLLVDVLVLDDDLDMSAYADDEVSWGGPVDTDSGTIVTAGRIEDEEGWVLPGGIGVTRSHDALVRLVKENAHLMLCLGYAGWGRGQLESEIRDGSWLFTDLDPSILFEVPPDERYDRAFQALGVPKEMVWMQPVDE